MRAMTPAERQPNNQALRPAGDHRAARRGDQQGRPRAGRRTGGPGPGQPAVPAGPDLRQDRLRADRQRPPGTDLPGP
ncbi:hypothetical protein G6F22_020449 [Rhizopus arrhizus]|nr:hypothetical protein G6F22_020449 [Rhizopus arrhizus]